MSKNSAPTQAGLLTALGTHLELLGTLLQKADAYSSTVPQSNVANLFRSASAYVANIANDPSLKKLAGRDGQRKATIRNLPGGPADAPADPAVDSVRSSAGPSSDNALPSTPDELREAARTSGAEEVLSVLERRADPNHVFSNFKVGRRSFVEGTALGIAAHRGQLEVVSTLLRFGARPDATYSVVVGAEKTTESFPVGFSTVRDENTEMLELLLDARADLHTMTSSLGATMLWEAAYFGKEQMAQYVLDRGIDIDAVATSQDNRKWKFTPLHAACYKGEIAIVNMLLRRTADVEGRNESGRTPLADAIIKGHGDIVRMLISDRANLFDASCGPLPTPTSANNISRKGSFGHHLAVMFGEEEAVCDPATPIQLLFAEANDHVIAEAAKGLQVAPRQIDTLTFIRFLAAKGNAPLEIMKAIAQPQELWYWNKQNERAHVQTAMMAPDAAFIVAYGPHRMKLKAMFDKKEMVPDDVLAFIHQLAPSRKTAKEIESRRVRGRLMMCDVPGIFFNPEVLLTMTECPLPEFFEMQSVQAIVNCHWREVAFTANFQIVFQVLYCSASMCLNILLLEFEDELWRPTALACAAWTCFAFWLSEVTLEICEMVGFYYSNLFIKVYCNLSNVFDWARLMMSGGILVYAIILKEDAKQDVWFNCCFGFMMMVRWMRVLYVFRAVKFFGIYLLPITTCLSHVVPFCAVLFPFVLGFANMYYAFGRQSLNDALLIVLRLILLGDQNLSELEGIPFSLSLSDDRKGLYVAGAEPTEYYYIVRVFMVVCAMVMGTAMMNIFIAVLSEEYSEAYRIRHGMFFRSRAQLAIKEYIAWRGMRRAVDVLRLPTSHSSASTEGGYEGNYVWYFTREEDLVDEALVASLENHKAEIINELQKQHSELVGEMRRNSM